MPINFNLREKRLAVVVIVVLVNLIVGVLGGFLGVMYLATDNQAGQNLGMSKIKDTIENKSIVLEESSAIIDAAKKVSPAVVSISTSTDVMGFFGQIYQQKGGGTGFIITTDGMIVTNKHVVSDVSAKYQVFTADGKDYEAKVLAIDSFQDLAVIKISASGLPVVELGDSDKIQVGQWVIAIGNALGEFDNSVTVGVVSAKGRQVTAGDATGTVSEKLEGLIQTDAAINPGNSGGPLINLAGQVVGVNTAVAGNAENIGFALPISLVQKSIEQVKANGKIVRPYLGVRYIPVTKEIQKINNLAVGYGVLIIGDQSQGQLAVLPNSPAKKAGLKEGDIITEINGDRLDENNSLTKSIQKYNAGETVELTVIRESKTEKIKVILEEMPE